MSHCRAASRKSRHRSLHVVGFEMSRATGRLSRLTEHIQRNTCVANNVVVAIACRVSRVARNWTQLNACHANNFYHIQVAVPRSYSHGMNLLPYSTNMIKNNITKSVNNVFRLIISANRKLCCLHFLLLLITANYRFIYISHSSFMLTFYHAHYLFIYQCMYFFTHAWEKNARPPDIDKRYIITIDFRDSISTLKYILTIYILALLYILGWYMTTHYWDVIMGAMASQITSLNYDCLLNRSFRRRSKKTSKLRVTGHCAGNSPMTGEFPAQMASNAENFSIWWRHHVTFYSVPHSG